MEDNASMNRLLRRDFSSFALLTLVSSMLASACGGAGTVEQPSSGSVSGSGGGSGSGGESGSGGGSGGGSGSGGGNGSGTCPPVPACDTPPPDPGPELDWKGFFSSTIAAGIPSHRGRDLLLNPGDPQWVLGKFAYSAPPVEFDKDMHGEQVDIWLLRGCGDQWELLGSALTSDDEDNATVEGVKDTGGWIYFKIPADKALGIGIHRIHMVLRGDLTTADQIIEVAPPDTPVFVSDIDGTLTSSENAEFPALLSGSLPDVHSDASAAFRILIKKGYRPLYLTARPEWLGGRTRKLLDEKGFPVGAAHTTLTYTGATGDSAVQYKTDELAALTKRFPVPSYAFGNTDSDAQAYENAGVKPLDHRIFYQFDDLLHSGRRIESYTELLEELEALPVVCK